MSYDLRNRSAGNAAGQGDYIPLNSEQNRVPRRDINPDIDEFIPIEQNPNVPIELKILKVCRCILIITFIIVFCCSTAYVCTTALEQITWDTPTIPEYFNFYSENDLKAQFHSESKSTVRKFIRNFNKKYDRLQRLFYSVVKANQKLVVQIETLKEEFLKNTSKQIEDALDLYDADKLGIRDYALESAGGYIISTPNTKPYITSSIYPSMNIFTWELPSEPRKLIEPGSLPGQCFAFYGHKGTIRIGLSSVVFITAVTIEHTPPSLVENVSTALKEFDFYGLKDQMGTYKHLLGSFVYRINKKPIQTFKIFKQNKNGFQYVELDILTNHGHPHYTSIYRVRVHGYTILHLN